jgi:hypothetical protein
MTKPADALGDEAVVGPAGELHHRREIGGDRDGVEEADRREAGGNEAMRRMRGGGEALRHRKTISSSR